ncbi:sugar ABC transporter ATP-binding protein [Chelatococcus reniformis]|uniref:Sugar ABC transporter ATP-binding protein n=1 Tax=Chelatococcus reniformis TaxID=1494448 RepID=A0A916U2C5_9HYPH|nr:sugar ABC transporter ATP-binding protein [Chelatococcus reniformis]GGC54197.1 sugar ABC transporter ATP-binding protein [Chelatococcus reniformis]
MSPSPERLVPRPGAQWATASEPAPTLRRDLKSTVAIRVRNVSKAFPGVQALRGVNFELFAGEVHGLVGANGAGKSTFIRMLSGASRPDTGDIEVQGSPLFFDNPRQQRSVGIAAIYQELTIIPEMSALSNAFLGAAPSRFFFTDRRRMERRFAELAEWMGLKVAAHAKAGTLSVAQQQMLEIMRAVQADQSVLIMDEPTAPLGPYERSRLYDLIGRLKASGVSIIFISHDLDEVLRLCDRVSVMREGLLVATKPAAGWSKDSLVGAMLGNVEITAAPRRARAGCDELLRVSGVTLGDSVADISFILGAGEVLGIAGLVGAGRTELLRAIAGAEPGARGALRLAGVERALPWTVRDAIRLGVVLAPEDRKRQGLVLSRAALPNLMLADLGGVAVGLVIDRAATRARGTALARQLGFDPNRLGVEALTLSGGNQQKLVLGKWLNRKPRVLLLDEPTRGIDLGAKQEIFQTIRRLSAEGMGVILVSSDLEEVVEHADRVLVMARGRQIGLLEGEDATVERILNLIFAVEDRAIATGAN